MKSINYRHYVKPLFADMKSTHPVQPFLFVLLLALAIPLGIGTLRADPAGLSSTPLAADSAPDKSDAGNTMFQRLHLARTGITHTNRIVADHPGARAYFGPTACPGAVIGDVNLDGFPDIFVGGGANRNSLYLAKPNQPLSFTNEAESLGLAGTDETWVIGCSLADVDNDGDLDLYLCHYDRPNQLWENLLINGGGRSKDGLRFVERAEHYGLDSVPGSIMSAFADYDRDGDLDVYILASLEERQNGRPVEPVSLYERDGKIHVMEPLDRYYEVSPERGENGAILYTEKVHPDRLFRNDGEQGFVEVTAEAGLTARGHFGGSATWWDYNHDGWPDLYVGNDVAHPDFVYRNNGDGTFTEVSQTLLRHTTFFSMGAAQADINNDGLVDFITADMRARTHYMQKATMGEMGSHFEDLADYDGARQVMQNALYLNTGTDRFLEGAWLAGLAISDWTWAVRSADFDNDGWVDVFFANGAPRSFHHADMPDITPDDLVGNTTWNFFKDTPEQREQNLVFRNRGGLRFEDVSKPWGLDHVGMSLGASRADFDGDGRLDLVVTNLEDSVAFFHNRGTGKDGNRVVFDFAGKSSNRFGIGCQVTLETKLGKQVRQMYPSGGFLDGDDSIIHFGMGEAENIISARIDWPSGHTQVFRDLEANRKYLVTEPEEEPPVKPPAVKSRRAEKPWFVATDALNDHPHRESIFDDFKRQPLLPMKHSQLGPGQAWDDIDNDGDPDFYLGGAAGQPGQLFRNETPPGAEEIVLTPWPQPAFEKDRQCEDMAALFFDADGDGDSDLYVVSGGVECEPGDEILRDRLYRNDGSGRFEPAPETALPDLKESGSTAVASDFDRDGDLDLFVGSRLIPGKYPLVPRSQLLRNRGDGTFEEVAKSVAPALAKSGLVTAAIWSDVDADGWPDLLVAHDWGGVKLYQNQEGELSLNPAENTGFGGVTGWWNGIDGADIDNDGDIDFVVTNLGKNTQYHASSDRPELIYYGDVDGTGKSHIIEANYETDARGKLICYPRRGLSCSSHAMPLVKERMKTYHNFASAALSEIYDATLLDKSVEHRATEFASMVMINDGTGKFQLKPLPHLAQISPGYGVALADVDFDGKTDCYIVQNLFTTQHETGAWDSGLSLLLRGTGDPDAPFQPVWPKESGLEVPGDAKSLACVDVNLDGLPDYVVGINNESPSIYLNRRKSSSAGTSLRIRLKGRKGNPRAIGSRITVRAGNLPPQSAEVRAGGGYLSQSRAELFFAAPKGQSKGETMQVNIIWPDGKVDDEALKAGTGSAQFEWE